MFQTSLEGGVIKYTDSPLLRAIKLGRIIVVDEADKAAEHVVAIFRSLAGQGELDGFCHDIGGELTVINNYLISIINLRRHTPTLPPACTHSSWSSLNDM